MSTNFAPTIAGIRDLTEAIRRARGAPGGRVVAVVGAAVSKRRPTGLPDANELLRPVLRCLVSDPLVARIVAAAGASERVEAFFKALAPEGQARRALPPEVVYDVLYEYGGDRALGALDPLKPTGRHGRPNANHRLLAALLHGRHLDRIVTTNFDTCLEAAWKERAGLLRWPAPI